MSVAIAILCLAAFAFLAACGDDDVSPADSDGEPWDMRDAFRPGSGKFGWMVGPGAEIRRD